MWGHESNQVFYIHVSFGWIPSPRTNHVSTNETHDMQMNILQSDFVIFLKKEKQQQKTEQLLEIRHTDLYNWEK